MDFMIFSFFPILEKLILGMVIGGCIGLTGVGGGVLIIPSLTLLFGMPTTVAVGTANFYAFLCKVSGTFHHWKQKTIALKDSMFFLAGAVPANLVVAYIITQYAQQIQLDQAAWDNFQIALHDFIAGLVIFSAVLMLLNIITNNQPIIKPKTCANLFFAGNYFQAGKRNRKVGGFCRGMVRCTRGSSCYS